MQFTYSYDGPVRSQAVNGGCRGMLHKLGYNKVGPISTNCWHDQHWDWPNLIVAQPRLKLGWCSPVIDILAPDIHRSAQGSQRLPETYSRGNTP